MTAPQQNDSVSRACFKFGEFAPECLRLAANLHPQQQRRPQSFPDIDVYVWAAALQKWPEATKHVFSPLGSENWADNVSTVGLQLIIQVNLSMLLLRVRWSRF